MLLGDDYFSHDEESADLLETDDEDEGNRNSHSESSESSEPSDDFPKFIYSGRERDEANHGNTSREGEGFFQMTDDSDVQSETKTNLQFSIKKELAKMCQTGELNLLKREQIKRNVSTEEPLPRNPGRFPAYSSCPVPKRQQNTSVYARCTQASTQGSETQSHRHAAFDRDLPSFSSFSKSDEQGRSESCTSSFSSTTQQPHASSSAKRTEQGCASTQGSQTQSHGHAAFDRDLPSFSSFGKSDEQGRSESCTSSFSSTSQQTHASSSAKRTEQGRSSTQASQTQSHGHAMFAVDRDLQSFSSLGKSDEQGRSKSCTSSFSSTTKLTDASSSAKRTEQGGAEKSTPNISTNPPPYGTPGQTTYRYLPATQEEKSKDSAGTLIGYYFLMNSEKSFKLEVRYPGMENVSNSLIII